MSNEELVAKIQAGSVDLMGQLWEQVEGLVKWKAKRIMTVLEGCPGRGVEFEDLYQSGYLAMVAAVDTYDPASGASFSTWLMYHLKTAFAEATGYRTQKGRQEPLNNYLSLDTPLTDEADGDDLMDIIADPTGQNGLVSAEESLYREQLQEAIGAALSTVPEQYREILRLRYWENMTLAEAGELRNVGAERVRQMENKAIRQLRKPSIACHLRPFYDFDFYCSSGFGAFQSSGMSIQERYLILEEECQERAQRRYQEQESRRQKENAQSAVRDTIKRISREAEEKVSRMSPEEKRALLEQYGLV